MDENQSKAVDLLGLRPASRAIEKVVDGVSAVVGKICMPAAEEIGLLFKDKISRWRQDNIISTAKKLEQKLEQNNVLDGLHAHPRIVKNIMDQASWTDDPMIQDMWAGLLSSSCTNDGSDDSNLIFTNLLASMTRMQARLLKFSCENASKSITLGGLINANVFSVEIDKLFEIALECDIQRLDREMDHLRSLGLLEFNHGGFPIHVSRYAYLTPSPLALHMYVRCQGSRKSPAEFFNLPTSL